MSAYALHRSLAEAFSLAWEAANHAVHDQLLACDCEGHERRITQVGGGVITDRPYLFPRLRARLAESIGGYGTLASYAAELDRRLGPPGLGAMAGPLGTVAMGSRRSAPERSAARETHGAGAPSARELIG